MTDMPDLYDSHMRWWHVINGVRIPIEFADWALGRTFFPSQHRPPEEREKIYAEWLRQVTLGV